MEIDQLKQRMRGAWMAGDFGQIASYTAHCGEAFVDRLQIQPGTRALDVACRVGQGSTIRQNPMKKDQRVLLIGYAW